ncbi:MAG: hypothetical protein AB7S26_34285 [Sandaracinaceae bacterium]
MFTEPVLRAAVVAPIAALLALAPRVVCAQDEADAESLFREGVTLLGEGRYEPARAVLTEAFELEPRASTAFNLASALHALGRSVEAQGFLDRIESGDLGPLPEGFSDAHARLRTSVRAQIAELALTLGAPAVVDITIDGAARGTIARGSTESYWLAAGEHRVGADANGFAPFERALTLSAGGREALTILLQASAADRVDPAPATPDPDGPDPIAPTGGGDDAGVIVGVVVGIGLALAVAAAIVAVVLVTQPAALSCDPVVGCIAI